MWGKWKYHYKARYTDSLSNPEIHSTKIDSVCEITKTEAEELIKEQLNANEIYPAWVQIISME